MGKTGSIAVIANEDGSNLQFLQDASIGFGGSLFGEPVNSARVTVYVDMTAVASAILSPDSLEYTISVPIQGKVVCIPEGAQLKLQGDPGGYWFLLFQGSYRYNGNREEDNMPFDQIIIQWNEND